MQCVSFRGSENIQMSVVEAPVLNPRGHTLVCPRFKTFIYDILTTYIQRPKVTTSITNYYVRPKFMTYILGQSLSVLKFEFLYTLWSCT